MKRLWVFRYTTIFAYYTDLSQSPQITNYDALYEDREYGQGDDGLVPQETAPIVSEEFFPLEPLTTDKDIEVNGSGFGSISKELDFARQLETPNILTTASIAVFLQNTAEKSTSTTSTAPQTTTTTTSTTRTTTTTTTTTTSATKTTVSNDFPELEDINEHRDYIDTVWNMFRNGQLSAEQLKNLIQSRLKDLEPTIILDVTDERTSLSVEASQNGATFNVKSEFSTSRVNRPKMGNRQEILKQATPRPTMTTKLSPTTKTTTTSSTTRSTTREPEVFQRDMSQPRTPQTHSAVRPLPKPFRPGQCGGVIHVDGQWEIF